MSFYVNASLDSFENLINKSSLQWVLPLLPFVKTENRCFLWRFGRWRGSGIALFLSVSNVLFSVLCWLTALFCLQLVWITATPRCCSSLEQWHLQQKQSYGGMFTSSQQHVQEVGNNVHSFSSLVISKGRYTYFRIFVSFWPQWCCFTLWITRQEQKPSMTPEDINLALITFSKSVNSD